MRARICILTLAACLAYLVMAADASAHAYPINTSPAIGGVVKASPKIVSITYDEAVTVPYLAVYDAAGKVVSSRTVAHPAPDKIDVAISGRLPDGTYTVAWRVTSADTHIVHGVYRFSVGRRGSAGGIGAKLLAQQQVPEGLALGFGVVRFLNLALLLLCAGGAITLVFILRDADDRVRKGLLRALTIAAALLTLAALLGLPFQAAEATGTGLGGGFAKTALETVRHQRFGEVWLVRAWLAVVFGLLAFSLQLGERGWQLGRRLLLVAVGIALLLTSTDSGHASVSGPVAFVADGVHITGAAIWIGGLAFVIAAILLSRSENRWALAAVSVPRFSLMAMIAVPLLGAAGIVNAYVEVRAWRGLWETRYGVLILVKIAIALPLLALGAFNNRVSVPALRAGAASPATRSRFLRAVGTELALLLAVLGVTAALIAEAPAKGVLAATTPHSTALTAHGSAGPFKATVTVRPALVGTNTIDIRVTSARHLKIGEVDLAAVSAGGKLKPVNLNVVQLSATRFRVAKAALQAPGRWELEMTVRHNLTESLGRIPVTIGQGRR